MTGDLPLWQLPPEVLAIWDAAHDAGRRSREPEVSALRHEADVLWLLAMPPSDRRTYLLNRLDTIGRIKAHHPDASESHLHAVLQTYFESLDDVRTPITRGDESATPRDAPQASPLRSTSTPTPGDSNQFSSDTKEVA